MINVDEQDFNLKVIEESEKLPILIDFWAEWCGPCKQLGPVLEKLEIEFNNQFLLVKVDTEKNKNLAQQFQISSIPDVKLIHKKKIIDQFTGALPEAQIREMLNKHIMSDSLRAASQLFKSESYQEALQLLSENPEKNDAFYQLQWNTILARLAQLKERDEQLKLINLIPEFATPYSDSRKHLLDFLEHDLEAADLTHFYKALEVAEESQKVALEYFLNKVENSEDKELPKKQFFAVFAIIGNSSALVLEYRKKLSRLLF